MLTEFLAAHQARLQLTDQDFAARLHLDLATWQALLRLVKAVQGKRYLIGNNRGGINGWVGRAAIFGIATRVEPSR